MGCSGQETRLLDPVCSPNLLAWEMPLTSTTTNVFFPAEANPGRRLNVRERVRVWGVAGKHVPPCKVPGPVGAA